MITIPEGMGLEEFGIEGILGLRKRIKKVRGRGLRRRPFSVPPGQARKLFKSDKAFREAGLIPRQMVEVPDIEIMERPSKAKYVKVAPADSISKGREDVEVVGHNKVRPARNPDLEPVRGRVLEPEPELVDEGEGVDILPDSPEFDAETEEVDVPGLPDEAPPYPEIPKTVTEQGSDKLLYSGPSAEEPDAEEQRESHKWMRSAAQEEAEKEMSMGIYRVPEEAPLGQIDIIASAVTAIATGAKAYKDIKEAKAAKKAASRSAAAQAVQQAADFESAYNAQTAARYGPQVGPQTPMAPFQADAGLSTTTIVLIAAGGLAVLGIGYFLLVR